MSARGRHAWYGRAAPGREGSRPGAAVCGCEGPHRGARSAQAKFASASFQVADGRMTAAALAGSGW
jgi:hypothetical protein